MDLAFYFKNRWDLRAAWIDIQSDATMTLSGDRISTNDGFPNFSSQTIDPFNFTTDIDFTREHWKGRWQELTFTLGRLIYLGQKVGIHPYIGIDSGWANQSTHSYFSGQQSNGGGSIYAFNTNYKQKQTAWWTGPHLGCDLSYAFARGFSFYTNAAISGVYAQVNVNRNEYNNFNSFIFVNTQEEDRGISLALYAEIGLNYLYLINDKQALTFGLGADLFTVPVISGIGANASVRWDF